MGNSRHPALYQKMLKHGNWWKSFPMIWIMEYSPRWWWPVHQIRAHHLQRLWRHKRKWNSKDVFSGLEGMDEMNITLHGAYFIYVNDENSRMVHFDFNKDFWTWFKTPVTLLLHFPVSAIILFCRKQGKVSMHTWRMRIIPWRRKKILEVSIDGTHAPSGQFIKQSKQIIHRWTLFSMEILLIRIAGFTLFQC